MPGSGRVVLPATPPPDIDLPAWRKSTDKILAWNPDVLFLTHFGPHRTPRVHFADFWKRLEGWSRRVWGDHSEDQMRTPISSGGSLTT